MQELKVLLFGPGLSAAGQVAHCVIRQLELHVSTPASQGQTVPFSELQAEVAGFDHDQLQLKWSHGEEPWSLIPIDKPTQRLLIKALPDHGISDLRRWKRSTASQGIVWKGILYGFGFLIISVALAIWQHDRVSTWAANQVSMKTEKRLGDSVLDSLNPEANFLQKGAAVDAVKTIGDRLTKGSRYQYRWYVSKSPEVNAFAIPGGIIVVNRGLLEKTDTADELAAVLAHEVQHVEQRHSLKNMINSAGIAAVVLVVLGDANAIIMMMAHQASTQYFNRHTESDADLKGIQLLQRNSLATNGMITFFQKMEKGNDQGKSRSSKKNASVAGWFSSHPDTASRIAVIQRYLAKHPCASCASLTWDKTAISSHLKQSTPANDPTD